MDSQQERNFLTESLINLRKKFEDAPTAEKFRIQQAIAYIEGLLADKAEKKVSAED